MSTQQMRQKDLPGVPVNGGQFAGALALAESGISLADAWGSDPWAQESVAEPIDMPAAPAPLQIGSDSGLLCAQGRYVTGEKTPVLVTEHNADLVAGLTQDDIDNETETFRRARKIERDRIRDRVTVEEVTLPENPTAEEITRVAAAINEAFSDGICTLDTGSFSAPLPVLAQVYGTPDRAIVAVGEAVASRADGYAGGAAIGGAEATEKRWLERVAAAEAADKERHLREFLTRYPEISAEDALVHYYKSADFREVEDARDPQTRAALNDMAAAYKQALSDIRSMGGNIALHEESSKPGAKVVSSTADVWPSDWIKASNDCEVPLHIGSSINRAHYAHETQAEFKRRGQGTAIIRDVGEIQVDSGGRRSRAIKNGIGDSRLQRISLDGVHDNGVPKSRSTWYQGDRVSTYTSYEPLTQAEKAQMGFGPEENSVRVLEWEYRDVEQADKEYGRYMTNVLARAGFQAESDNYSTDNTNLMVAIAKRNGIKIQKHPLEGGDVHTDPDINDGKPILRKAKVRQNTTGKQSVSQIKLSNDAVARVPNQDPRYAPAVHEFGHRMEYLVPNLNVMARSWRDRRVTEAPNDDDREVRTIYRGTSEKGYRDSFVAHYIGRSYDDRANSPFHRQPKGSADNFVEATEVFSMGSDSVFAGRNGGLIGLSRDKDADHDMRHFILGLFATAGASRRQ
jgi:hypothetical protein